MSREHLNLTALYVLQNCHVPLGADFHTLRSSQVDALLTYADVYKYRAPKNANGSRGRYWHALCQRRAAAHMKDSRS